MLTRGLTLVAETLILEDDDNSSLDNHCSHSSESVESAKTSLYSEDDESADELAGFTQSTRFAEKMALEVSIPCLQILSCDLRLCLETILAS